MKKILTFMVLSAAMVIAASCVGNDKDGAADDAATQAIETKADVTDDCGGDCASCEHGCGNKDKACESDGTGCDHKGDGCKKGDDCKKGDGCKKDECKGDCDPEKCKTCDKKDCKKGEGCEKKGDGCGKKGDGCGKKEGNGQCCGNK